MDGIKYAVFTEKSLRLLGKNQYTFNVESGFTKTEIKHWVELFFGVKVVAVNSRLLLRHSFLCSGEWKRVRDSRVIANSSIVCSISSESGFFRESNPGISK